MRKLKHIFILLTAFTSCAKFVDIDPPMTRVSAEQTYQSNATAAATITAIYMGLCQRGIEFNAGARASTLEFGLYADELQTTPYSNALGERFFTNQLTPADGPTEDWNAIYIAIYQVNSAIEGLNGTSALSPDVKQHLLGEAFFLRGFFFFYLVNMFGDVPMPLTTDYTVNAQLQRAPEAAVYAQIVSDLKEAEGLLSDNYLAADAVSATDERVRPNKAAAQALLARAYLYMKDYTNAEIFATKVIEKSDTYNTCRLDSVFLKNSPEAIWQLPSLEVNASANTHEGRFYLFTATTNTLTGPPYSLTEELAAAFEAGDARRANWVGSGIVQNSYLVYFPYKYKIGVEVVDQAEYAMVLRVGEQFLIRAEARAMLGNTDGARQDLNRIRNRAGLGNTSAAASPALVDAILAERRVELFVEWGHRFLDLRRLNRLDAVLQPVKIDWQPTDRLFPIPQSERERMPQLSQNPGYN